MKNHSPFLAAFIAALGFSQRYTAPAAEAAGPAHNPHGKSSGGSGKLRRAGHSMFRRNYGRVTKKMCRQPIGDHYNLQRGHVHPRQWRNAKLQRPTFTEGAATTMTESR